MTFAHSFTTYQHHRVSPMNTMYQSHAPPRTLTQRIERLNETLENLRNQLKDEIARAVSVAVAEAIRDGLCSLFGRNANTLEYRPTRETYTEDRGWNEPPEEDEPWQEDRDAEPEEERFTQRPSEGRSRWGQALGTAIQTGLFWLRRQSSGRPILTAALVAVAGGITAFFAGPTLAASAVAFASAASLLMTVDTTGSVANGIAGIFG